MSVHFHKEVDSLKKRLLELGVAVEENLLRAVLSVEQRDAKAAAQVVKSERDIDRREIEIEEECLKILALYQPVAVDLRFLVAIIKINNDLEDIGDLAASIAESSIFLAEKPSLVFEFDFREMVRMSRDMVRGALDSLLDLDREKAEAVCLADDEVDELLVKVQEKTEKVLGKHPDRVPTILHYLEIVKDLEAIADCATNIAEDVIYLTDGKIVRHHLDEIELNQKENK